MTHGSPTPQEKKRPRWLRALDLPCFAVLALAQVARRRWAECRER